MERPLSVRLERLRDAVDVDRRAALVHHHPDAPGRTAYRIGQGVRSVLGMASYV